MLEKLLGIIMRLLHLHNCSPFPDAGEFADLSITAFFTSKEVSNLQSLLSLLFPIYGQNIIILKHVVQDN